MTSVIPRFNTRRMVYDYAQGIYGPAAGQYAKLADSNFAGAQTLADWKQRVRQAWPRVLLRLLSDAPADMARGERLRLRVAAALAGLQATDVRVEFVARRLLPESTFEVPALSSYTDGARDGVWSAMLAPTAELDTDGAAVFALDAQPIECGQFQTQIRIYPWHELLSHRFELGLMKEL
jgi:starch phosphorylase